MGKKNTHNPNNKYVVIDGIYFYKENTGNRYYLGTVIDEQGNKQPKRLHVYIWEREFGKVPDGCNIHHIDGDVDNNDISNLQCISSHTHHSLHGKQRADWSRQNLADNVRPKASEWHKSNVGRAYHKLNYETHTKEIWESPVLKTCEICGKEYTVKHMAAYKSRFCSNNCKSKFRRLSGVDNETRQCTICGNDFVCNKYSKQKVCSNKECSNESQRRIKTGVPRPQRSNP